MSTETKEVADKKKDRLILLVNDGFQLRHTLKRNVVGQGRAGKGI